MYVILLFIYSHRYKPGSTIPTTIPSSAAPASTVSPPRGSSATAWAVHHGRSAPATSWAVRRASHAASSWTTPATATATAAAHHVHRRASAAHVRARRSAARWWVPPPLPLLGTSVLRWVRRPIWAPLLLVMLWLRSLVGISLCLSLRGVVVTLTCRSRRTPLMMLRKAVIIATGRSGSSSRMWGISASCSSCRKWWLCLDLDPLGRLFSIGQHPPQLGIAPPMLVEELLAGLYDAPPRQGPFRLNLPGRTIPVLAGPEVFRKHWDLGRGGDGPAEVVLIEEVVTVACGLAERAVLC